MLKQNKILLFPLAILILLISLFSFSCVAENSLASNFDMQQDIESLQNTVSQHTEQISNISKTVKVTSITTSEVTITTIGAGNYPVIVTVFGSSLNDGKVSAQGSNCVVAAEYQPSSTILYIIIIPTSNWQQTDTIKLSVVSLTEAGDIHYVTAQIGAK